MLLTTVISTSSLRAEPGAYIALGDSYTIGTGVAAEERFPDQLRNALKEEGIEFSELVNTARGGETAEDLLERQYPIIREQVKKASLITVLIGTNDWVQGRSAVSYEASIDIIFSKLQRDYPEAKVLAIGAPDFASTPGGKGYLGGRDGVKGIQEFNEIICFIASTYSYPCVNIFPVSTKLAKDTRMLASDELHPSGAQYSLWVKELLPVILKLLKDES